MRLIDADALIENLTDEITNLRLNGLKGTPRPTSDLYDFIDRIKEHPTAYNVDAVVEYIQDVKKNFEDVPVGYSKGATDAFNVAIATIRKGGGIDG